MGLSGLGAASKALLLWNADSLLERATRLNDYAVVFHADRIAFARDSLYFSIALTAATEYVPYPVLRPLCTVATLGVSTYFAKRLYDETQRLQDIFIARVLTDGQAFRGYYLY